MSFFRNFWAKDDSTTGNSYHSSSYHRFFEGWVEQKVTDPKTGKTKIVRNYAAEYVERSGTDKEWVTNKIMASLTFLISTIAFIFGCYELESVTVSKYIELVPVIVLFIYFYFLYILVKFLTAPRKMTIGDYNAYTPRFFRTARLIFRLSLLCLAVVIVNMIIMLFRTDETAFLISRTVLTVLSYLAAGVLMLLLGLNEDNTEYKYLENEDADKLPYGIQINS